MRCCYLFAALLGTLLFTSCGLNQKGSISHANPGKHPKGTGPFDHNGNYVEAWADTPSKWSRKSSSPSRAIFEQPKPTEIAATTPPDADPPKVDASEQPPANAVPLPGAGESVAVKAPANTRTIAEAEVKKPASTVKKSAGARIDDDEPVRKTAKASTAVTKAGTKTSKSGTLAKSSKSTKTSKSSTTAKTSSTSKTTAKTGSKTSKTSATASKSSAGKSKVTAKTTPKSPKTKAKTSTVRYTVKKGESLAAIARRNKTTVTAIQKANGLKGATVPPGKTIVVPKY